VTTSHDEAPFTMMRAEETLARSITKVLNSSYQSVVVYPSAPHGKEDQGRDKGESSSKVLSGTVSSLALVVAMLKGGFFEVLRFVPISAAASRLEEDVLGDAVLLPPKAAFMVIQVNEHHP
jgi:hypothetical protein